LIGRDYGETEQRDSKPFQGLAGSYLNQRLGESGLRRDKLFIHNVVPKQPPGNKWERHRPDDIVEGVSNLRALLEDHQPKLVVTFGNEAFRTVMGESPDSKTLPGIQECRGFLWDSPFGSRVLNTIHPAAAGREWVPWMALLGVDLRKAKRELDLGCPAFPTRNVEIITEPWQLQEMRNAAGAASWVGLDIENDRRLELSCLGIAVSRSLAYVIPAGEAWQLAGIQEVLGNEWPKVFQNGQYDRYFLEKLTDFDPRRVVKYGFPVRNVVADTTFQWHVLQPELAGQADPSKDKKRKHRFTRKSLAFFASIYTRDPWWKDYEFESDEEKYVLCGRDCCTMLEAAEKMRDELAA